jgi:hypothetical protein
MEQLRVWTLPKKHIKKYFKYCYIIEKEREKKVSNGNLTWKYMRKLEKLFDIPDGIYDNPNGNGIQIYCDYYHLPVAKEKENKINKDLSGGLEILKNIMQSAEAH